MDGEYPLGLLVLELQPGFFGNKKWKVKLGLLVAKLFRWQIIVER
jgi:hypothetical protein